MDELLPTKVVCQILWPNHLGLLDKLCCQEVCKLWQHWLQSSVGNLQHAFLGEGVAVNSTNAGRYALQTALQSQTASGQHCK